MSHISDLIDIKTTELQETGATSVPCSRLASPAEMAVAREILFGAADNLGVKLNLRRGRNHLYASVAGQPKQHPSEA